MSERNKPENTGNKKEVTNNRKGKDLGKSVAFIPKFTEKTKNKRQGD